MAKNDQKQVQIRDEVELPEIMAEDVRIPEVPAEPSPVAEASRQAPMEAVQDLAQGRAGAPVGEVQMAQITHATGRALAAQPRVRVFLPKLEGVEPKFQVETVQINGWTVAVNRGVFVDVPRSVAEVLKNSGHPVDM